MMRCDEICGWCSYAEHHKCLEQMHIGTSYEHPCICQCRSEQQGETSD